MLLIALLLPLGLLALLLGGESLLLAPVDQRVLAAMRDPDGLGFGFEDGLAQLVHHLRQRQLLQLVDQDVELVLHGRDLGDGALAPGQQTPRQIGAEVQLDGGLARDHALQDQAGAQATFHQFGQVLGLRLPAA